MTMINQRSTLQIEAICDRNKKKELKVAYVEPLLNKVT